MIYTFRFISDESENFVLDVNINHDQTFEQLHQAIQNALKFDSSQLASFFTATDEWEKEQEIALMDMGTGSEIALMKDTTIEMYFQEKGEKILYVFDYFAERLLFGSISRTIDAESPIELPSVSRLDGTPPEQAAPLNLDANIDFDDFDSDDEMDYGDMQSLDDLDENY